MATLRVCLPSNRTHYGELQVYRGSKIVFAVPCLGQTDQHFSNEHGNPRRNPAAPFGDIPLGRYVGRLSALPALAAAVVEEYGRHGWILLQPEAGPALEAHRAGCHGFLISGGPDLGGGFSLAPTLCGVRLADLDMLNLRVLLTETLHCKPFTCDIVLLRAVHLEQSAVDLAEMTRGRGRPRHEDY